MEIEDKNVPFSFKIVDNFHSLVHSDDLLRNISACWIFRNLLIRSHLQGGSFRPPVWQKFIPGSPEGDAQKNTLSKCLRYLLIVQLLPHWVTLAANV